MANETEAQSPWKYCDLKGSMTITKLGDIVLVFLEDESVNPQKDVLKFKDVLNGPREKVFKSTPQVNWELGKMQTLDLEIIAAFDEAWFEFTIANGFLFKRDNGSLITRFDHLDEPQREDMPKMNPIVP